MIILNQDPSLPASINGYSTGNDNAAWHDHFFAIENTLNALSIEDNSMFTKPVVMPSVSISLAADGHYSRDRRSIGTGRCTTYSSHTHSAISHSHNNTADVSPAYVGCLARTGAEVAGSGSIWLHESFAAVDGFTEWVYSTAFRLMARSAVGTSSGNVNLASGSQNTGSYTVPSYVVSRERGGASWYYSHYNTMTHTHSYDRVSNKSLGLNWFTNDDPVYWLEQLPSGTIALFTDNNFPDGWTRWSGSYGDDSGATLHNTATPALSGADTMYSSSGVLSWSTTNLSTAKRAYPGTGGYALTTHFHGSSAQDHDHSTLIDIEPDKINVILGVKG
jgi:hypothetical protein